MAELTTKTGQDIAIEVKRLFGDEDAVQISNDDIVRWINAAQRKIVSVNPILQKTAFHDVTAGVASYVFDTDRVQFIQSLAFKGVPLDGLSYAEAQEYILKNGATDLSADTPLIWYQWAQRITLWPTPTTDLKDGLRLDFVAIPPDLVTLASPVALPDRYSDALVEFVMQKAHLLDENYDAANISKSMFGESLGQLSEQENRIRIATYPTITVREEDL